VDDLAQPNAAFVQRYELDFFLRKSVSTFS
jgi:hypothetical protein